MGFIDAFKRWRLARKGMSSGKKRRVQTESAVAVSLDRSALLRFALYLVFAVTVAILVMRGVGTTEVNGRDEVGALRAALHAFLISVAGVTVLELSLASVRQRNARVILTLGGVLAQLLVMRALVLLAETNHLPPEMAFLLTPFALAPMVHTVLLGRPAGVFSTVQVSLLGALLMPAGDAAMFIGVSLLCGLTAVQALARTRRRVQLLRAGLYSGLMALVLSVVAGVIDLSLIARASSMAEWKVAGAACAAALGTGIGIALLVSGFLPVLEGVFNLTTDISWLELGDLNHRLMRRLQLEAPGTFHHSLVVASLSEAAAEAIGANAAMCRVCAYFHDIGKLKKPEYFIENQNDGLENPHDALTPTMSALIIIAHVKDGVDLAVKQKLNPRVIDVIREHHGDSLVSFFYRRAQEQKLSEQDKIEKGLENPEDLPKVDQKNFRYPGPRPRTRESGIISLADAVESASRTLKKPTPGRIRSLVEDLINKRLCDGQLDDCQLTVKEISILKDIFSGTLRSMLHSRIDYPKDEEKKDRSDLSRQTRRPPPTKSLAEPPREKAAMEMPPQPAKRAPQG